MEAFQENISGKGESMLVTRIFSFSGNIPTGSPTDLTVDPGSAVVSVYDLKLGDWLFESSAWRKDI